MNRSKTRRNRVYRMLQGIPQKYQNSKAEWIRIKFNSDRSGDVKLDFLSNRSSYSHPNGG